MASVMGRLLIYLEQNPDASIMVVAAFAVFFFALLIAVLLLGRQLGRMEASRNQNRQEKLARSDAVKRSRAVLTGQIGEQFAPYLPDFPADAADARFLGKPVDYIVFNGLASGLPDAITFVEVKSGKAALTPVEKAIKEAVQNGRVFWLEYRIPDKY